MVSELKDSASTRPSTGYDRKRRSESRAVSITPTVLSVTLDQIEAIHSDDRSVVQRLRSLSMDEKEGDDEMVSMSPSQRKPVEVNSLSVLMS